MSSISSFSSRATNGHQPFTLFCLKMEMVGSSCSFRIMSREHCLAVLAPRGNRFRSSSIAPGSDGSQSSQTMRIVIFLLETSNKRDRRSTYIIKSKQHSSHQSSPRKSSAEKWSASQTCSVRRGGILYSVSSQENMDSFLEMTIFSSAMR